MGKKSRKERRKAAAEEREQRLAVTGETADAAAEAAAEAAADEDAAAAAGSEAGEGAAPGAVEEPGPPEPAAAPGAEASPREEEAADVSREGTAAVGEAGEEAERVREGLARSRRGWVSPLARIIARRRFDEDFWEEVEEILIGADVGVEMTRMLVDRLRDRIARDRIKEADAAMHAFCEEIEESLRMEGRALQYAPQGPSVWLVVGVNGTGKTTTIAKLAYMIRRQGGRVLLAAGDTFRAAGIEQLEIWGERVGVHTVKHRPGADAAAVAFDAVQSAKARGMDVVIVDTAGRLHTKINLMEELKKIKRVAGKEAPVTETLLVLDATTGQNGLVQARLFKEAVELTGVALTKLDGTARGGIVIAIQHALGVPIKLIGVGEKLTDLYAFDPGVFARALFSGRQD
jgi:fused signal recognition particle receptor